MRSTNNFVGISYKSSIISFNIVIIALYFWNSKDYPFHASYTKIC